MAHTITVYRGRSFDAHDSHLELIVVLLTHYMRRTPQTSTLTADMLADWTAQRRWAFGVGVADLHLDRHLQDHATLAALRACLEHVRDDLAQAGEAMSADSLNELMDITGHVERYLRDQPVAPVLRVVEQLIDLVKDP